MAVLSLGRLLRMVTVRATIFGGVVYYTIQEGVWSSADDTIKVYERLYNNIAPYVKDNMPKEVSNEIAQLPSTSDVTAFVKTSWNKGVMASIKFMGDTPTYMGTGVNKLAEMAKSYIG